MKLIYWILISVGITGAIGAGVIYTQRRKKETEDLPEAEPGEANQVAPQVIDLNNRASIGATAESIPAGGPFSTFADTPESIVGELVNNITANASINSAVEESKIEEHPGADLLPKPVAAAVEDSALQILVKQQPQKMAYTDQAIDDMKIKHASRELAHNDVGMSEEEQLRQRNTAAAAIAALENQKREMLRNLANQDIEKAVASIEAEKDAVVEALSYGDGAKVDEMLSKAKYANKLMSSIEDAEIIEKR